MSNYKSKDLFYASDVEQLGKTVFTHSALNNKFYDTWQQRKLNGFEYAKFAKDYYFRVGSTVTRLSHALTTIEDPIARLEILHNINDELGHGDKNKIHISLAFRWLSKTLSKIEPTISFQKLVDAKSLSSETTLFINETNKLCSTSPLSAAGALLAQEWHGYTQIGRLLDGSRHYEEHFDFEEKHAVSEYFYVHLGSAEREHIEQTTKLAAYLCHSDEDFEIIQTSFNRYLELLSLFWEGAGSAIYD